MLIKTNKLQRHGSHGLWLLCIATILFTTVSGCKDGGVFSSQEDSRLAQIPLINADIRMNLRFDEKTYRYSTIWPESIVGSLAKTSDSNLLLDSYEYIRNRTVIDSEGYIHIFKEWPDGDNSITLPGEIYNQVKSSLPSPGSSYDPVVRSELSNGMFKFITKSGLINEAIPYDKSAFKVDVDSLLYILNLQNGNVNQQQLRQNYLASLESNQIAYSLIDENLVSYNLQHEPGMAINTSRIILDLRNGQPVYSVDYNLEGMVMSRTHFQYRTVSGYPVLENSTMLKYGQKDGAWGVVGKTVVNRSNISVQFN